MAKAVSSHEPVATANATAATVAVLYVVCAVAITLAPDVAMTVAKSWFHGVRLEQISGVNLSADSLVTGFITASVGGWLLGFVFATFYTLFAKKK